MNPWLSLLWMVLAVVLVTGLAYLFTRYVVGNRMGEGKLRSEGVQVLTCSRVGREQKLAVVKAGDKYLLLGITPQNITMLTELSPESCAQWEQKEPVPSFREALKQNLKNRGGKT